MPQSFSPGQRWVSNTESKLGLGMVSRTEGRTVTVVFPAAEEMRTYASDNAPLTRALFNVGDTISDTDGREIIVNDVSPKGELLIYQGTTGDGEEISLPEFDLSHAMQLNRPLDRLLTGQLDKNRWFELRYQTQSHLQRLAQSPLHGLSGVRTELLPHQIYIAHEVSRRGEPRVLLADEVGLGKTIEACLIMHRRLLSGEARRVLIVVPEPLLHQWLVELLRRFNLRFSIFDEERCKAIEESTESDNPFGAEQLVLCSIDLFTRNGNRHAQALHGEWDLLIVDEAHHLEWSESGASEEYLIIESLAARTPGVLLLTATPEQLGRAGHFARLRLLDPDRFHSLEQFLEEEQLYAPVAEAVDTLLQDQPLDEETSRYLLTRLHEEESLELLSRWNDTSHSSAVRESARDSLIEMLLDRHGTGRVLYRNTRARIEGFPQRTRLTYPLPLPESYEVLLEESDTALSERLRPETLYREHPGKEWWRFDPRVEWLISTLGRHPNEKILLICAKASTARELAEGLKAREGINAGLFHEGLTIVERDRTAAWFADPEEGCQLLICSEIGSEGRNFQFAHHLVLFDLPLDPDLLEQRIGRLDRIGQRQTIQIHLPYFEQSPQEVLLRWFDEGLGVFEHYSPAGHAMFSQLGPMLTQALEEHRSEPEQLETLIESTRVLHAETREKLKQGQDHLLELNSCRQEVAAELIEQIHADEASSTLESYLDQLLALLGANFEEHSPGSLVIRPSSEMVTESLPGLPEQGLVGTTRRHIALMHEDRHFLSWEHPLVRGMMETVRDLETGNSCAIGIKHPRIKSGTLILEPIFTVECLAPRGLQADRFLPVTPLRLLLDQNGNLIGDKVSHTELNETMEHLDPNTSRKIISALRDRITQLMKTAESAADRQLETIRTEAVEQMQNFYHDELQRLKALQKTNPNIRPDEIKLVELHADALHSHLAQSRLKLDAVRLCVSL
jgi:ATP-dependent helicase HepA